MQENYTHSKKTHIYIYLSLQFVGCKEKRTLRPLSVRRVGWGWGVTLAIYIYAPTPPGMAWEVGI